ncbi:RT_Bac_retron_I domain containing protein [uncultured Caudovirales phage]|uniref:RT_Bac_retron_I domain containing protein n=1 Tax=uncultured Caudovirales phage TaxID=2100421 RepID=A0A6J5KWL5_9CAUD|nr:RT_Bac_retron_I domain containing protein [uncultured Caudovirales phage]
MKRIGNLFDDICSIENLQLADERARKGKRKQPGVVQHDLNREGNITALHEMLVNDDYYTSPYTTFTIYEPKERLIFRLPYFPDRIVHHAIMNKLEPMFVACYTKDTYSCVKGRGIHGAWRAVKEALEDREGTQYCVKFDIRKFYPSIDHDILKALLRRKLKDERLLHLLDEIIDSADGLPIGNYLSQFLANFYLTYFDHWLKEVKGVKYYFRYADDIVILADNKPYLHQLLADMRAYLDTNLKLQIKQNYQVFPVSSRGIDFVGYVFYHTHILLRKRIKQNFARKMAKGATPATIAPHFGWMKYCNSYNLLNKFKVITFKDIALPEVPSRQFTGDKISVNQIINREIEVHAYKIEPSKFDGMRLTMQIMVGGNKRVVFTGAKKLQEDLERIDKACFPFKTTIISNDRQLEFS